MSKIKEIVIAAALGLAFSAQATVLLSNNFDTEAGGARVFAYNGFSNFTVIDGTVDLIEANHHGVLPCAGNTGSCVDLDGATGRAGILRSKTLFDLGVGSYRLRFELAGNHVGGSETVTASLGNVFTRSITIASDTPFTLYDFNIDVLAPTSGYLSFWDASYDYQGALLDNVLLESKDIHGVPEPCSLALLTLGLAKLISRRINLKPRVGA